MKSQRNRFNDDGSPPQKKSRTAAQGLFAIPVPLQSVEMKNPLRKVLEQHFNLMNKPGLQPFHYSEILREIACYHRHAACTTQLAEEEKDILSTTLFLYEKALIVSPQNPYAATELMNYKKHQAFISEKNVENDRIVRYTKECNVLGRIGFFWISLDKYLDRLQKIYPNNFYKKILDVCSHLNDSHPMKAMRTKHISQENKEKALIIFTQTVDQLNCKFIGKQTKLF